MYRQVVKSLVLCVAAAFWVVASTKLPAFYVHLDHAPNTCTFESAVEVDWNELDTYSPAIVPDSSYDTESSFTDLVEGSVLITVVAHVSLIRLRGPPVA